MANENFLNNLQLNKGNGTASENLIATYEGRAVYWMSNGGVPTSRLYGNPGRSVLPFFQRLCSVRSMDNATAEAQNERDAREAGKFSITIDDGKEWSANLTMKGGDVYTLAALQGRNLHNLVSQTINMNAGIRYGESVTDAGHIIIVQHDKGGATGRVTGSMVYPNCTVSFPEAPGITDAETDITVTITSKTNPYQFGNGIIPVPFMFFDDGVVTNAAAPTGALASFAIKDANEAYGSNAAPAGDHMLQIVDPNQSGIGKYVIDFKVGGQLDTGATVAPATATITPSSVPADGAMLSGIVAMPTGFPDFLQGTNYSTGSIVKWDGSYYVANKFTQDDPTTTPLDWDAVTLETLPYWGTVDGSGIENSNYPNFPGWGWLGYNWFG